MLLSLAHSLCFVSDSVAANKSLNQKNYKENDCPFDIEYIRFMGQTLPEIVIIAILFSRKIKNLFCFFFTLNLFSVGLIRISLTPSLFVLRFTITDASYIFACLLIWSVPITHYTYVTIQFLNIYRRWMHIKTIFKRRKITIDSIVTCKLNRTNLLFVKFRRWNRTKTCTPTVLYYDWNVLLAK